MPNTIEIREFEKVYARSKWILEHEKLINALTCKVEFRVMLNEEKIKGFFSQNCLSKHLKKFSVGLHFKIVLTKKNDNSQEAFSV